MPSSWMGWHWISPLLLNTEVQKVSLLLAFVQCHTKKALPLGIAEVISATTMLCFDGSNVRYSYLYCFNEIVPDESHVNIMVCLM